MSSRTKRAIVWRIIFRRKGNAHTQREPTELFLQSLSGRRCIGRSFFLFCLISFQTGKAETTRKSSVQPSVYRPPLNYYSLSAAANTARRAEVPATRKVTLFTRLPNSTLCWTGAGWLVVISCRPPDESSATSIVISYRSRTTFNSSITNKEQRGGKRSAGRRRRRRSPQTPRDVIICHSGLKMQWGGGIKYINTFSKENEKREREKDDPLKAGRGELVIANLCNVFNMTKTFFFSFSRLATFRRGTQESFGVLNK